MIKRISGITAKVFLGVVLSISFCSMIFWIPTPASAMSGAMVAGCCSSTGMIATPMGVNMASTTASAAVNAFTASESSAVQSDIEDAGEAIVAEIAKNRKVVAKLFENQNSEMRQRFVEFGAAQEEMYAQKTSGPAARFESLCAGPEVGGRLQVGKKTEKAVAERLSEDTEEYANFWATENNIQKYISDKEISEIKGDTLVPKNKTMSQEEIKDAQDMAELMTEPFPEVQLTDKQKSNDDGMKYENMRKIKKARLAVPRKVINKNIAAHSPSMPLAEQARQMHEAMGGEGEPEEVVDGKISPYAMIDLMVDSRFANPNWYAKIAEKNMNGMMREMMVMNAVQMEMQRRSLELEQMMALMKAGEIASKANNDLKPAMAKLYNQVAGSKYYQKD